MTTNSLSWFEIPVADFDRARAFYGTIFDYDMPVETMGPATKMGIFLHERGTGVGGAIVTGDRKPSEHGSVVYLTAGRDLQVVLSRVEQAGGTVILPKTPIAPGMGFFALLNDSEGNRVGLHSME
ncbi:MAG: VOC family protein [Gemmatimonadota bacterium]